MTAGLILGGIAIAIVSGFVGGVVSHSAFPAKQGQRGEQGPVGQTGPAGPTGTGGTFSTANLGYCVDTSSETLNNYTPPVNAITYVGIYPPTITNGTQSCPSGTFEPISSSSSSANN